MLCMGAPIHIKCRHYRFSTFVCMKRWIYTAATRVLVHTPEYMRTFDSRMALLTVVIRSFHLKSLVPMVGSQHFILNFLSGPFK